MSTIKSTVLAASALLFSSLGHASDLSYSNVGVSYLDGEVADLDVDGFGLDASLAVGDLLFIKGSYARVEADDFHFETDNYGLGLGFHVPITDTADFVMSASWLRVDAELCLELIGCGSGDDNGWGADAGIRWLLTPNFEASIFAGYADISDEDDTAVSVGARYFVTPMFSLGAGYSTANDADSDLWNVDLRYHFE